MIVLEDLTPILEPLLEGREDAASVIESVKAIDKEVEAPDNSAEIAKLNDEWNERFKKAFFGDKGEELEGKPITEEVKEEAKEEESDEVTGDNITIDDLFEEKIIE